MTWMSLSVFLFKFVFFLAEDFGFEVIIFIKRLPAYKPHAINWLTYNCSDNNMKIKPNFNYKFNKFLNYFKIRKIRTDLT